MTAAFPTQSSSLSCLLPHLRFRQECFQTLQSEDIRPPALSRFTSLQGLLVGAEDLAQIKLLKLIRASMGLQGWRNVPALKTSKNNNRAAWFPGFLSRVSSCVRVSVG
ncbi:hypothetical protein QQF64_005300 [Cirrhinus molitorella]|uniref:Uncharacterized protein n=1 Tax=Cirrhinus molitorella TaxID=172907 RepID=A0ABR3ME29_9TELE